jgi:hypothetical protein
MEKRLLAVSCAALCLLFLGFAGQSGAQNRKAVTAGEVNGTFRSFFGGRYKGSYNEIKILALGNNRLKVAFELVYPFTGGAGEMSANLGTAEGEATIEGDTAVYSADESGPCRIIIKFIKPGEIRVTQEGTDTDCGFGRNVTASGTYRKTSAAKPKF